MKSTRPHMPQSSWRSIARCLSFFSLILLFAAASVRAQTPTTSFVPGVIKAYAGNGATTGTYTDGAVPTTVPVGPVAAVAIDNEGDVFFAGSANGNTSGDQVFMVYSGGAVTPILSAVLAGASPVTGGIYLVGNVPGNFSLPAPNTPFSQFPLGGVTAMAFDNSDNLYLADQFFYNVVKVNASDAAANVFAGQFQAQYGQFGAPPAVDNILATQSQFFSLGDLKVDTYGNIYTVDLGNAIAQVVYSGTQPPPVLAAEGRTGLTKNFIYQIAGQLGMGFCNGSGNPPCIDTGSATSSLGFFTTAAVDAAGNVYLQDDASNSTDVIYVGEVNGAVPPLLKAVNASPQAGDIYPVAGYGVTIDPVNGWVGCTTAPCGDGGLAADAQFGSFAVSSMLVDAGGSLYLADSADNSVRKIDATTGVVSSIVNSANPTASAPPGLPPSNGTPAVQAKIDFSSTITFDAQQNYLYVNGFDQANTSYNILFQVGKVLPQTITFPSLGALKYGTQPFRLAATSTSGLTVQYTLSSGAPATITGSDSKGYTLTITGAGSFTITAIQPGNAQYAAATPVPQTVTVSPASLTVTAGDLSFKTGQFDPNNPGYTFSITGFVNGDSASLVSGTPNFTLNPAYSPTSPQTTYQIIPTLGTLKANANYTFAAFVDGTLTITGTGAQTINFTLPASVIYGQNSNVVPLNGVATSGLSVKYLLVSGPGTITGTTLTITGAGAIKVEAMQSGNALYAAAPSVLQTLIVTPAPLTVTLPSLSLPYGTNVDPTTFPPPTITGFVGSDSIASVTITTVYTSPMAGVLNAGVYPVELNPANSGLTLAPAIAANYTFANFINGQLTIVPTPQSIVAQPLSVNPITYGTLFTLTANATSGLPVTVTTTGPLQVATVSGVTAAFYATAQGPATITITQAGTQNIAPAAPVVLTINIGKAPLDVTAQATATRIQGAPNPTFTYTVGNPGAAFGPGSFINGDSDIPSVITGVPLVSTTADQNSPPGNYPITISQGTLAAPNYYFVFQPGTLIVTPPGYVTISASPSSLTVPTGLSAQTTLTLTPTQVVGGFTTLYQGTITLSCGQVPANVSCIISPATYTFPGNQTVNVPGAINTPTENVAQGTLTITASGATVVGSLRGDSISRAATFLVPAALGGLLLSFTRRRAARKSSVWGVLMLLALGAGMLVVSSCGGSSKMSTAAPGATTIMISGTGTDVAGNTVTATLPVSVTIQ